MKERSLVLMVLLVIITFGLYGLYWYCSFQNQLKKETGAGFGGFGHLMASIFTFGIYAIVWNYKAGKRLEKLGATDLSIVYLLLILFAGLGAIINPLLMQSQANKLK